MHTCFLVFMLLSGHYLSKLWSNVDQEENITSDIVIMLTLQTSHILKNFVM